MPGWSDAFPWLCAGTTRRTANPTAPALADDWAGRQIPAESVRALGEHGPWRSVVRGLQVHGTKVRVHGSAPRGYDIVSEGCDSTPGGCDTILEGCDTVPKGFFLAGECDGHATRTPGLLLTATAADCVPVFLADPAARAVALLHAGWRGAAGGVVEAGVAAMADAFGSEPSRISVHAGPAICGRCYEVGPEVFAALGLPTPSGPTLLDLRAAVRQRAESAGVPPANVTTSDECTLCGDRYFSHRGGDQWRHLAFVGILPRDGGMAGGGGAPSSAAVAGPQASSSVGLCGRCTWSRTVETRRGSVFRRCLRHREDPSFPKYPTLPVRHCRGFETRP